MADSPTRILIADDHPIVRQGLDRLLSSEPGLAIVAEATTPDEVLAAIDAGGIDFVVLDVGLREGSGLEVIGRIRAGHPDLPILVLSMHPARLYAEHARAAGAQGYAMKQGDPGVLVPTIRRILAGDLVFPDSATD